MSNFACQNCGLSYDTPDELQNHQKKFCVGSNYEDLNKLDSRYAELKAERNSVAPPTQTEIRGFVSGSYPAEPIPMAYHDVMGFGQDLPDTKRQRQPLGNEPQDLLGKAEQLKMDRAIQRQLKSDDEKDVLSILQDLENKKEKELRAQIEKEEIYREIKNTDDQQLGYLAQQKKQELNKLAQEHEAVRLREQSYMDEISKMEASILDQERFFKQQRDSVVSEDPNIKAQKLREVKDKEMKLAAERAQQVAKVKVERERLERERLRIMDELEKNKNKKMTGSRGGFRENTAAKRVGSALSGQGGYNSQRNQQLEPSLKDKLIADQVRLNNLKHQNQITRDQQFTDVDDVDVLDREMKNQPNLYDGLRNLKNTYEARSTPNKNRNLAAIQNRLEYEGGVARGRTDKPPLPSKQVIFSPPHQPPSSKINVNNSVDDGLMGKLDDLEGLLLGGSANQSLQVNHMHELPRNFQAAPPKRGVPPMPTGPQSGVQPSSYMPQQTPFFPEQQMPQNAYASQGSTFAPPQMGFGQNQHDVYPFSQPFADPALAQLASMMQNQEDENKKLREVLENFAKNTSTYDNLEQQLRSQDQEIKQMADGRQNPHISVQQADQTPKVSNQYETDPHEMPIVFPDEFAFRQNDQRADDLEVEERALMNLAAQEYDQLRVIQKLPKGSDIYEYKLKQYKEVSRMRTEIEKVLQEQRLEKIQRDFKKQKDDEDRQLKHLQWMEQQKRSIVDGRVHQPQQPEYGDYQQQVQQPPRQELRRTKQEQQEEIFDLPAPTMGQAQAPQPRPMQDFEDPSDGSLLVVYDVLFGIPKDVKQLQIVARTVHGKNAVGEPALIGPVGGEPDMINQRLNKILYNQRQMLSRNNLQKPVRLILELQAPDPQQSAGVVGTGWTYFDMFHNGDVKQPATGLWKLPIYAGMTQPDAANSGGKGLIASTGVALCIRIGEPGDQSLSGKADHRTTLAAYTVPRYHEQAFNQAQQNALIQQANIERQKEQQVAQKPAAPVQQRDPNYRNSGIRARLHYILNNQNLKNLSVKVSIQDKRGQIMIDSKGSQCSKNLPPISDNATIESRQGEFISLNSRQAEISQSSGVFTVLQDTMLRPFDAEIIFSRDFFKLFWDKQKEPLILQFELFAKAPGKQSPMPYALSQFEINNNDGTIKYGFFSEQLMKGVGSYIPGEFIGFTLSDPTQAEPVPREKTPQNVNDVGLKDEPNKEQQQLLEQKPPMERPYTGEISEQFIKNKKQQYNEQDIATFMEDIDVYIDAARHLPDNVTITQVKVRVLDHYNNDLISPSSILANVEKSSLRNQEYGMKIEIRPKKPLKSTAWLYMSINTLDISKNCQAVIVGKVAHPLYIQPKSGLPPETEKKKEATLQIGNYQLAIFSKNPIITNQEFTFMNVYNGQRIPASSLLIRVVKAPLNANTGKAVSMSDFPADQQDQAKLPIPDYNEGVYQNQIFAEKMKYTVDIKAMNIRSRKANPPLQRVVDVLGLTDGKLQLLDSDDLVRQLETNLSYINDKSPLLDLDYHSQYEPSLGFAVSVEAIHNNKKDAFYCVLASILPNAHYYDPKRTRNPKSNTYTINTAPDFDDSTSTSNTYLFEDGDTIFNAAPKVGMSVIFDIKRYLPDKELFEDYGFAVVPLFTQMDTDHDGESSEFYFHSGIFSLPVFQGRPSQSTIDILKQQSDPTSQLDRMQQGKLINYLGTTSIIVKVVDSQRRFHFGAKKLEEELSYKYIKEELKKQYKFTGTSSSNGKKLKDYLPKKWKADREGFKIHLKNEFYKYIGLISKPKRAATDAQGQQQIEI